MESDLNEWKLQKDSWSPPSIIQPYQISTCTVGVQVTPAVSFSLMASWLFANRQWNYTKNNTCIQVDYEDKTEYCLKTISLWNPHLFKTEKSLWEQPPSGHLAHNALPNYCYNSVTFLVHLGEGKRKINVKYFVNGSMTLTGCSELEDAKKTIEYLIQIWTIQKQHWFSSTDEFQIVQSFIYRMINAYFSFNYALDCLKVYHICSDYLKLYVSYDPKQYQGVIIYYLWNQNQVEHNGICQCTKRCLLTGKRRRGETDGDCIKITFIVFSTGNVLITGAISKQQIEDCYRFFCSKFTEYGKQIVQFSFQTFLKQKAITQNKNKSKPKKKNLKEQSLTQFWPQV